MCERSRAYFHEIYDRLDVDVREVGSGNIGTANVLRAAGKWAAILTLFGDMLKGFVPVVLARVLVESTWLHAVVALADIDLAVLRTGPPAETSCLDIGLRGAPPHTLAFGVDVPGLILAIRPANSSATKIVPLPLTASEPVPIRAAAGKS